MMNNGPLGFGIPLTWARDGQTILGTNAATVPLTIKAAAGQSTNVFQVVDSTGLSLLAVDQNGNLTIKGTDNITINNAITGNLTVAGSSSFTGLITGVNSTFTGLLTSQNQNFGVSGSGLCHVFNALTVDGASLLNGGLNVIGSFSLTGAMTATTYNNVTITNPGASGATLTLVASSTLATSGAFSITLTSTAGTNVTLPTTGTLATLAGSEVLTNKTFRDGSFTLTNTADTTKIMVFSLSGITTGTTRTVTMPDASGTMTLLGNASTGSGSVVLQTSPALITPTLGVASCTTLNKYTFTTPTTGSTLTIVDGKTLTINKSLTLDGTDSTTMTFPSTSGTVLTIAATQAVSNKTLDNTNTITVKDGSITFQNTTDTTKQMVFALSTIATATTRTITFPDASGTATLLGNASTGSGSVVLQTSPALITPTLGVASCTTLNKYTFTTPATGSTLTIADGKTLTANNSITIAGTDAKTLTISNSLTLAGTDSTTMTFPSTSATIARTDTGQTFTGTHIFTSPKILTSILDTNANTMLAFTTTGSAVNWVSITNAATGTAGPIITAAGETNIDLKITGKGTGAIHHTSGSYGDITADADGATITFDLSVSNIHSVTLGGNRTLALSNGKTGQCFMLRLLQDATGSRTVTWFTTIKWAGGSAPTLTTTASKADMIGFVITGTNTYDGFIVGANL